MSIDEKHHDTSAAEENPTPAERPPADGDAAHRAHHRGFAAMDRERVKAIASKGGRAAHAAGTAHQFSREEARVAGKKGGMAPHVRRGGVRRRPVAESGLEGRPPESTSHGHHGR